MTKRTQNGDKIGDLKARSSRWMVAYWSTLVSALGLFILGQICGISSTILPFYMAMIVLSFVFFIRGTYFDYKYKKLASAKLIEIHRSHFGTGSK